MQFAKMHGLGNDFMVVDAVTQNVYFSPELIRRLSDRNRGVGFDQLLVVEPPYDPELDFHYPNHRKSLLHCLGVYAHGR